MGLVLDASATLAWLIGGIDHAEARLADEILQALHHEEAAVPSLWFPEVANGVLVAERRGGIPASTTAAFLALLETIRVVEYLVRPHAVQGSVLEHFSHGCTPYPENLNHA